MDDIFSGWRTDLSLKANRVYVRAGSFSRSPSKLPKIKATILRGAGNVSEALTRICGSEVVDLAIV